MSETEWRDFACFILKASYEATFNAAAVLAYQRKQRVRLILTCVGGGAFGNDHAWIAAAIGNCLTKYAEEPIDVVLLHYSSMPAAYETLLAIEKHKL